MFTKAGQAAGCDAVCAGGVREGTVLLAPLSCLSAIFLGYPQLNWALPVLISGWLCVRSRTVGLSNELSCEAGKLLKFNKTNKILKC